jgi:hypothetical protein
MRSPCIHNLVPEHFLMLAIARGSFWSRVITPAQAIG